MPIPLYSSPAVPVLERDGHRGLWHERFFCGYSSEWGLNDEDRTAKQAWIDALVRRGRVGDRAGIDAACERIARLGTALKGETRVYAAGWHFATGLGNPHPVENGFLWHHVLGTPYIPGSAVKGLVRTWVEAWMPFAREQDRLDTLCRWFGSESKDFRERQRLRAGGFIPPFAARDSDTEAGAFIFFDALPTEPVTIKCDVMTPHMSKWYEQGGDVSNLDTQPERIPADWHDPVPVYFLVADRPKFQFVVAPRTASAGSDLHAVLAALDDALQWLGAGAKTAVGYGQMMRAELPHGNVARSQGGAASWTAVRLQFNKGSQEIAATGPCGERAFAHGKDAQTLIQTLANPASRNALERSKLVANIGVEHAGGKCWRITAIEAI